LLLTSIVGYFAREPVSSGTISVSETAASVANTLDVVVWFTGTPPAVSRWIPVEPIRRSVSRVLRLRQTEPVDAEHTRPTQYIQNYHINSSSR